MFSHELGQGALCHIANEAVRQNVVPCHIQLCKLIISELLKYQKQIKPEHIKDSQSFR